MCGFAGVAHWGRVMDAPRALPEMAASLHHRGPDDQGFWSDENAALSFVRLSIVEERDRRVRGGKAAAESS